MYSLLLVFHIVISIVLIVLTLYIFYRSLIGTLFKLSFSKILDYILPAIVVLLLYFELFLGLLLYAFYITRLESLITHENGYQYFSARFWAVEHAILMFFAIIFGHLGLVYSKNLSTDKQKFKKNLIYFGLTSILIIISITMNMLRNG